MLAATKSIVSVCVQSLLGLLAALLATLSAQAQDLSSGIEFRRGIAIAHAMAWVGMEANGAFVFPPFAYPGNSSRLELQELRRAGFDFVRLAIDPGPFLQVTGSRRDQLDRMLMDAVRFILS